MRRLVLWLFIPILILAASVAAQDETVQITWPPPVYDVSGTVQVSGTVNPPDLQSYFLEVAAYDADPANILWIPVSLPSTQPVVDGVLADWITTLVSDGVYQLRLHVLLRSGENLYAVVGPIRVANTLERPEGEVVAALPTAIPAPTEEPTPAEPTDVPRPVVVNDLPIPVGGQLENFDDNAAELMRQAGMTWVKWQIPFVIGDDSLYTVARDRINWTHEHGFNVLLSVRGELSELAERGDEYYGIFAGFLTEIAAMNPDAIEVWNEMNLDREWPRGRISANAYVEMLEPAYQAIKAADPTVMVISGAPSPTGFYGGCGSNGCDDGPYYQGMAAAGAADHADCIGAHYNEGILAPRQEGGDPRDSYPTRYFPLMTDRAAFPFRNDDIPLCYTELGYLSPEGYGELPGGFYWAANTSVAEQAEWLRDAIQIAGEDGRIAMIIVWNINYTRFDQDPQGGYAIIRPDGTCPACETIATLRGQG